MEKILGIAIVNGQANVVEVEDDLAAYYELLGCNYIEIATRRIGKHNYDIVCDEEGALKENHISATDRKNNPMIVGNLFICKSHMGDLISLDPEDILHIAKRLHRTVQYNMATHEAGTFTVVECAYPVYEPTDMDTYVIDEIAK